MQSDDAVTPFDPLAVECDWDSTESIAYAVAKAARRAALEEAADIFRKKARKERNKAHYYAHENEDSLGRFHPCPASAAQCEKKAALWDGVVRKIRALIEREGDEPGEVNGAGGASTEQAEATDDPGSFPSPAPERCPNCGSEHPAMFRAGDCIGPLMGRCSHPFHNARPEKPEGDGLEDAIRDGIRAANADDSTRVGIIGRDTAPHIAAAVRAHLATREPTEEQVESVARDAFSRGYCAACKQFGVAGGPSRHTIDREVRAALKAAWKGKA